MKILFGLINLILDSQHLTALMSCVSTNLQYLFIHLQMNKAVSKALDELRVEAAGEKLLRFIDNEVSVSRFSKHLFTSVLSAIIQF